jgi:two-component system, NarL family, invasion response regulator UvrY
MRTVSDNTERILLIDDHTIVRSALRSQCLELYPKAIIEESADGIGIMPLIEEYFFNLVIIDLQIPQCNTLQLIKDISSSHPEVSILVYSMTSANIYALKVMKAGAKGFVSKVSPIKELETAIGLAFRGKKYISEEVADLVSEGSFNSSVNPFSNLSSRQLEIASLLLTGETVTSISRLLQLGTSTIGTHKSKIFKKLGVKNVLELKQISDIYPA